MVHNTIKMSVYISMYLSIYLYISHSNILMKVIFLVSESWLNSIKNYKVIYNTKMKYGVLSSGSASGNTFDSHDKTCIFPPLRAIFVYYVSSSEDLKICLWRTDLLIFVFLARQADGLLSKIMASEVWRISYSLYPRDMDPRSKLTGISYISFFPLFYLTQQTVCLQFHTALKLWHHLFSKHLPQGYALYIVLVMQKYYVWCAGWQNKWVP